MGSDVVDRRPVEPPEIVPGPREIVFGRYQIGRELGRGGKASVFLARDRLLRRDVAVKVFRARAEDPEELRTQEQEAKLIASLNHYALTTLFDAGADTTDPAHPQIYLVMEYMAGSDLRERVRRGPLDPMQGAYLGFDLADGLLYLHQAGFLHRDIKPANVLLASRADDVRLRGKLADFGISSLIGAQPTGEGVTGTAAYLSPEQAAGEDPGPESDVYSLGLVLLEALTGRVAFPGDIPTSAMARLDHDPLISALIPAPLAEVLRGMTHRDRSARMTLPDVIAGLQDVVVDDVVRQRTPVVAPTDPESARLAAVHRLEIVDSPVENAFDDVTDLLCRALHVPVAVVAVLDRDRAWFAARRGVTVPEVPRDPSREFTKIAGAGTWVIPDLLDVKTLRHHPLVRGEPFLRSAIAAPLITHDGQLIGRIVVCDRVPRVFAESEVATVEAFGRIVMRELELRLASRRALFDR